MTTCCECVRKHDTLDFVNAAFLLGLGTGTCGRAIGAQGKSHGSKIRCHLCLAPAGSG